jgi:hypothetical protein
MAKQNHKEKFTDNELIEKYNELKTLSKIAHYFKVPDITIYRRSKKLGLEYKIGGANKKFELNDILNGLHPQYPTLKLKNRLIKENLLENKCSICGINNWLGKEIKLQLDHIDGNSHNHLFENLRLLCPNCHSQTETYCGKNKKD